MKLNKKFPEVRFPKFQEDWKKKKLGELLEFKNGINASREQYGKGIKFINVLDILNNDFLTYDQIIGSVDVDEELAAKYTVEFGDILFQRSSETRAEVGSATVYLDKEKPAVFGGFVIRGKKIGEYNPIFLNKLLKTDKSRNTVTSKSGGSTRYNVGQEILSSIELFFPALEEQTAIAGVLNTMDLYYQELKKKKQLIEFYKRGAMQSIFCKKNRFTDIDDTHYPNWEQKRLGEICKIVVGGTPSTAKREYWGGTIGWIGSGEIKNNHIKKPTKYITELGLKKSSTTLMPKDTVVLAMTGATLGKIGILDFECTGNQSVAGFLPSGNYDSLFLFFNLQFETNQIESFAGGAAQAGINKKNIEGLRIYFPCLAEQQKISTFLSSIDETILILEQQLQQMARFKEGLLRKMFI